MAQYELNLIDYLRIFRKRKLVIAVTFILAIIISSIHFTRQPVFYKASATVKIEERKTVAGLLTDWISYSPADIMESQAKIITGYPIMKKVGIRLGVVGEEFSEEEINRAVNGLQAAIETGTIENTNIIRITATADTAREAMVLANMVTEVYIQEDLLGKTKQARRARKFIEEQLFTLETRLRRNEENLREFDEDVKNVKLAGPIQQKLVDLEFQLNELLQKYTDKHPRVIQLRQQIKSLQMQIDSFSGQELDYARLKREVEVSKELYAMLKEKLEEARISEAEKVSDISMVDPAVLPLSPVSTDKNMGILVGGIMGLVLGVSLAFVTEALDTSIGTIEDVESVLKLPVLGVVPSIEEDEKSKTGIWFNLKRRFFPAPVKTEAEERFVRMISHYEPTSPAAEAYRAMRTNLKLDSSKKTILVTSSGPREGKTSTLINLGIVMGQAGSKTLLVSSDLRRPVIARTFGVEREPGFHELISGSVKLDQVLRSVADVMLGNMDLEEIVSKPPGIDNIWVLPSGSIPINPAEILESNRFAELLEELKQKFDIIIFDSPPVLPVTDASLLAPKIDQIVLVYEFGRTSRDVLMRTKVQLQSVGGKIAGVVLNHTKPNAEMMSVYPYYSAKYRYYRTEEEDAGT